MKFGIIRTAAISPALRVADCAYNAARIIEWMREAEERSVSVAVFPELSLTGYTCGDLFGQARLREGALEGLKRVLEASRELELTAAVGLPVLFGGKLYNAAAMLSRGKVLGVVPKSWLPNYGEFYEQRNFVSGRGVSGQLELFGESVPFGADLLFEADGCVLGVEICEDLWVPEPPSVRMAQAGANLILNLSASNEVIGKADYRRKLVLGQSARLICGYVYADAGEGESTTDMVFASHDIVAENGVIAAESTPFAGARGRQSGEDRIYSQNGCMVVGDLDLEKLALERSRMNTFELWPEGFRRIRFVLPERSFTPLLRIPAQPFVPRERAALDSRAEQILTMQAMGLKKRIEHSRAKTVVIGISGGLDSTLATLVAVRAMDLLGRPHTDVVTVTMPCFGTTDRTHCNAVRMTKLLGTSFQEVDIRETALSHFEDIGHDPDDHSVVFENGQARIRTLVLMDIANQTEGIVGGTGDLSELALGWATYNGDHMSMYGINASVPKTLIRHLVRYEADRANEELKSVLTDVLDTPVSPELLPAGEEGDIAQKTEDLVGPYELHDFFLYYGIRWGFSPKKVSFLCRLAMAGRYPDGEILKWLKVFYTRFFAQQFKRSCLPDGVKIGSASLSPRGDWRMPSDACAALWLREIEEIED